ncbi:aldehyde dehydrogenase family protein [Streptomyces sp. NPDC002643]
MTNIRRRDREAFGDDAYGIATPKRSFNVALNMSNAVHGYAAERRPGSSIMTFSPGSLARELLEHDDDKIRRIYLDDLDQVLPGFADKVVEAEVQRWPTGAPYCFPGRGRLQQTLTRRSGRVLLAGDYLGTLCTETAISSGLSAAQEARSLVVIFPDADLTAAASSLRVAGFWNSGQECGAACRVLVHASVAERFVEQLVDGVRTLVVGEPQAGEDIEVGPMVSKAHFDRVTGYLERATKEGVRAATGGGALDGPGYFVAPTVLVDVPEGAEVAREEIFGPVITVETFTDEEEAVRRANDVPLGLSASVWTENARRSHDIAARLDFGTVWVNSHLVLASEVPWGGFKGSGYGRDLSLYALDDYSRTKHVMHNHGR